MPEAKGVDPQTLSTIIVAVSSSPVLIQLGRVLSDWVNRCKRKVIVRDGDRSLEIDGPIDDGMHAAIDSFFRKEIH